MRINPRIGKIAAIVAGLYDAGRRGGVKGRDIFGILTSHDRYKKKESAAAMELYGFEVKKTPKGDYWVSDHSSLFSRPGRKNKKKPDDKG